MRSLCFALSLLLLFASCGKDSRNPSGPTGNKHSLSGKLLHVNGLVITEAKVLLSGDMQSETESDSTGAFVFTDLPDGAYSLSFAKKGIGFESLKKTFTI
ncbi:MAG: carboxypeptidase-like regulatory domain-containing protein, partial [Candidatus Latescibacterota bacterium]